MHFVDIDGDGLKDLVTGKRFWSHGRIGDPDRNDEAVLYWFQLQRKGSEVDWVPHRVSADSGVGTQVVAGDINKDGAPDIVVGNKKGVFVHLQQQKKASEEEWQKAQPQPLPPSETLKGIAPVGQDGKPLNLDFEAGSLKDWTASGTAFNTMPEKGDAVARRRNDMRSGHRGEYWVGSYESSGDAATGTLVSAPFIAAQPYASFLIGGGANEKTRVEIVNATSGMVLFRASGSDAEEMRPVFVDLRPYGGAALQIRLIDEGTTGWGHLNFDEFVLHSQRPTLAEEIARAE
jgi:hypothetical protein